MRSAIHFKFMLTAILCLAASAFSADAPKDEKKDEKKDDKVTVLVMPAGTKYHVEGCPHCGKEAKAIPLAETKGKFEPCADCKPDATVYITKTGEKFHCKDCTHAKGATALTLAEAVSKKMHACKTCNPPDGKKPAEPAEKKNEKKPDANEKNDGKEMK